MYKIWLALHMIGVATGAGTGIYLAAVARHAGRNLDQSIARTTLPGINGTISNVGKVGLLLLIVSGVMMWLSIGTFEISSLFLLKLILVATIVAYVALMTRWAGLLASTGDKMIAQRMKKAGLMGPLLGVATIVSAVWTFN